MFIARRVAWIGAGAIGTALALLAPGCATDRGPAAPPPPPMSKPDTAAKRSLYERLGGEPAITAVVDDFVGRAAGDPKVNFTRKGTAHEWAATPENVAHLKKLLVQFIAMVAGGPKHYEGRDMKSVHAGMRISNAEFDALAGDLEASLGKFHVGERESSELLALVGSTRADVVEP